MSDIRRVINLGANPWVSTGPGHCGGTIKLAIRCAEEPRALRVEGSAQSATFQGKRRDGARWWTTTVSAPWWVGTVWIEYTLGDRVHRWPTEVLPEGAIFPDGRAAVDRLIERLIAAHAHLPWGGTGASRAGDLDEDRPEGPTPPKLHIAALDAWMPRLLTALGRIERQPLPTLVPGRAARHVERVGRVDGRTLVALARQPALAAAIRGAPAPGGHPRLDVPAVGSSLSHPANRALVHGLRDLDRRLRDAHDGFAAWRDAQRGKGARARKDEAERQMQRLQAARARIAVVLRRRPWRGLTPAPPTPSAEQVFADDPLYGEAMRTLRRLQRPAVRPQIAGLVAAHLRPIFDLWEQYVWCRIVAIVRHILGTAWRWTPPRFEQVGLAVGPAPDTFAEARRDGWTVRVGNQMVFRSGSGHVAEGGGWSVGRFSTHCTRKPDVTIEVSDPAGALRWLVVDAKFTAGRYAVESLHLPVTHYYRDGLRLGGRRPDGVFLALPALDDGARCYADPAYHAAFDVGVLVDRGLTRSAGQDTPLLDYGPVIGWLEGAIGQH